MIARGEPTRARHLPRWPASTGHQAIVATAAVLFLVWLAVVVGNGALLAWQTVGLPVADSPQRKSDLARMAPAGLICLFCLSAALLSRRVRPAATALVTVVAGGLVLLASAVATGSVGSLLVVLALFGGAWLVGNAILARLPATGAGPLVAVPIALALGSGCIGFALLFLANVGALNAATVAIGAALITLVVLGLDRRRLADRLGRRSSAPPSLPNWWETVVLGLTVGLVAYALLAALTPEAHSDATRHHLPIAREIWQSGSAPEFVPMSTSRYPVHAHLLYAVAYGFGGMTAAKLVHSVTGLVALAGIAGLGWLCAGRTAAIAGASLFATLPLVLWELGLSLVDFFPVLAAVTAALCILLWQRDDQRVWLLCAGALAGVGFAAKMTAGVMIVALAAAVFLVGRESWRPRDRVRAALTFAAGCAVIIPWLVRSYVITGAIPGVSLLVEHVSGTATSDLPRFGLGRSPLDLLRIPWEMTFRGEIFHQEGAGDIGIALLLLLPLALFAPRTRAVAFLATTLGLSYLGWAFTAQLTRYLLPTLALAAALAGVGVAGAIAAPAGRGRRVLALAVPAGVLAGIIAAPFLLPNGHRLGMPILTDLITGKESSAAFVARAVEAAPALSAATAILPPDTPVGYFGKWEGPQIYTEARLTYFGNSQGTMPDGFAAELARLGTTPDDVLASLERLGTHYFIWERATGKPEQWRATVLSTDFLRRHTRILAGGRNSYLFEVLPGEDHDWTSSAPNLLRDPGFDRVGEDEAWAPWRRVKHRQGVVSVRAQGGVGQRTAVRGGSPYVLLATARCDEPADRASLALRWFAQDDTEIGLTAEAVIPGAAWGEQFVWQRAPENATSVAVELSTNLGAHCDFDAAGLYGPS